MTCNWCSGTGRDFRAEADPQRLSNGFVACSKCGGSGHTGVTYGVESKPQTDISKPRSVSPEFDASLTPNPRARALYHQRVIRAEVEAMDWPEVIGE